MTEKLSMEAVQLRVHDVRIKGNRKTNDSRDRCAAEGGQGGNKPCKSLSSSRFATIRLRALGGFDKCVVTLDPGPNVLPGTANVIVEVEEAKHPFAGDLGVFSNPEIRARWPTVGTWTIICLTLLYTSLACHNMTETSSMKLWLMVVFHTFKF